MGGYTRAASGQRLGKYVPVATDTNTTIEEVRFLRSSCRDFISKGQDYSLDTARDLHTAMYTIV
jgi:hypothetical protein